MPFLLGRISEGVGFVSAFYKIPHVIESPSIVLLYYFFGLPAVTSLSSPCSNMPEPEETEQHPKVASSHQLRRIPTYDAFITARPISLTKLCHWHHQGTFPCATDASTLHLIKLVERCGIIGKSNFMYAIRVFVVLRSNESSRVGIICHPETEKDT